MSPVPPLSLYHEYRYYKRLLSMQCKDLKLPKKITDFVLKFYTVLTYKIWKKEISLEPATYQVVALVSIYQASKMKKFKISLKNLTKKLKKITYYQLALQYNKEYEEKVNFKTIKYIEEEYKKIEEEYRKKGKKLKRRRWQY
ncbi:MAG: hypothetical protein ACE5J7_03660 [Candidatus Aenigmatarchaeota archaeon]